MLTIIIFIIINSLNNIYSTIINLKGQGRLSVDTLSLLLNQPIQEIGTLVSQEMTYNLTDTDINTPFHIVKTDLNGEIGAGQEEYLSIIRNHKIQSETSVFVNYLIDQSVIPSTNYSLSKTGRSNCNVNCTYSIREVTIDNMTEINLRNDYKKYLYYSHFIIVLDTGKMYQIINNELFLLSLSELQKPSILNSELAEDFWIINKDNNNDDALIVLTPTKFLIYNIVIINGIFIIDLKTIINRDIFHNIVKINSVGLFKEYCLFATSAGILIVNQDDSNSVQQLYSSYSFTDLIVLYSSIYTIAQGRGLFIISIRNPSDKNIINLLNIKQIDLVQNPFTGNDFIGVLLDTMNRADDFFIEYYIPIRDELHPIINKVFCSEGHRISSYTTPDSFYSYFLNGNTIYVIRRGMLNKIPTNSLALRIHSIYNITHMSKYYNQTNGKILPAISSINKFYPFQFTELKHEITCIASQSGKYILIFKRITDVCQSNIGYNLKICSKTNFYYFTVLGNFMNSEKRIGIIISSVIIIGIGLGVFIYCSRYTNWFKNNRLKLIQIDKNNRTNLYKVIDCNVPSIEPEKNDIIANLQTKPADNIDTNSEPVITVGRFVSSRLPTTHILDSEIHNVQANVQNLIINSNQNLISAYHHVASKNIDKKDNEKC